MTDTTTSVHGNMSDHPEAADRATAEAREDAASHAYRADRFAAEIAQLRARLRTLEAVHRELEEMRTYLWERCATECDRSHLRVRHVPNCPMEDLGLARPAGERGGELHEIVAQLSRIAAGSARMNHYDSQLLADCIGRLRTLATLAALQPGDVLTEEEG